MFCLLSPCLCLLLFNVFFFFFAVISCKTHNIKLRYLRRQLQKPSKLIQMVVIRGNPCHEMTTKCHYVGIPKRSGPMRSSFFFCVDSVNFSSGIKDSVCKIAIFVSFRFTFIRLFCPYSMNQTNPTHLHSQPPRTKKNHVVIQRSSGSPTNMNQSWIMSFKYFHISNPSKNIQPQRGFPTPQNGPRHMVPTPMGLSLLAAFEELDPQWLVEKRAFLHRQMVHKTSWLMLWNGSWIKGNVMY